MLVLVGDEFFGHKAATRLGVAYRDVSTLGNSMLSAEDEYIAVVTTATEWERIHDSLDGQKEAAVIVCAQDCRPLMQLADKVGLVFAGIPRKDRLLAAIGDAADRDKHMASERNKINTARSIENLISAGRTGGGGA